MYPELGSQASHEAAGRLYQAAAPGTTGGAGGGGGGDHQEGRHRQHVGGEAGWQDRSLEEERGRLC